MSQSWGSRGGVWYRLTGAISWLSVGTARRPCEVSSGGLSDLRFGFLFLYPWLSGCRAGVHTHTTELEALSQSWESRGGLTYRLTGAISWLSLGTAPDSYTQLRAHDTNSYLV